MANRGGRSTSRARRASRLAATLALSAFTGVVCAASAAAQSAPLAHSAASPQDPALVVRAEGGTVTCCSTTGFIAGGGIDVRPPSFDGVEVGGDAAVGRFGGETILSFAATGLYGVSIGAFRPYGGGGVGVVKTTAGGPTNTGAELVAGVQWPPRGRHALRLEARFLFLPVETTFVIGSISF